MIDPEEAGANARELVKQYVVDANPACEEDYHKLLVKLAFVVSDTLSQYSVPPHAISLIEDALEDIADTWRYPYAPRSKRLH